MTSLAKIRIKIKKLDAQAEEFSKDLQSVKKEFEKVVDDLSINNHPLGNKKGE